MKNIIVAYLILFAGIALRAQSPAGTNGANADAAVQGRIDQSRQALRGALNGQAVPSDQLAQAPPPALPAIPDRTPRTVPSRIQVAPSQAAPSTAVPGIPTPTLPGQTPPPTALPGGNLPTLPGQALAPGTNAAPRVINPQDPEPIYQASTIQVQGMALDQFFELYALISGKTVLRPYVLQGAPGGITLKAQTDWTRTEAVFAMDSVLALNQIAMIPVDDKFVKAVPAQLAPQEGAKLANIKDPESGGVEQFLTQIVELKTVKPSEMAQLLLSFSKVPNGVIAFDATGTLVIRDYASNVRRMLDVIDKVDVVRESDYKLEVIPIKYGKVGDLYSTMSALVGGGGYGGTTGSATGSTLAGNRAGSVGNNRQTGRYGTSGSSATGYNQQYRAGQSGYQPQQANMSGMQQSVGAGQSSFQDRLRQIVSRAATGSEVQLLQDARIVPDERSNKLLIFANKEDMAMITNIVSKVDVLMAQVLIEAVIMEVKLGDSLNVGVSMAQQPKRFGNDFTGAGGINNGQPLLSGITNFGSSLPSGFSYFGKIGDSLDIAVRAIADDSSINILSKPRIQTSHAIPGSFFIGETVPYVTGFADYYGGIGSTVSGRSTVERLQVGLQLDVMPFITPEGLVVMEVSQTFDQRGNDVIIDGNPVPIINQRSATATLTVRDGDTIMMGGFITESSSKSKSGVPFLKDIPGLGALFRSKNNKNDRTELVILMRARVLETPQMAAIEAAVEQSQMQGIQQAEKEFDKTRQKREQDLRKSRKR